jgi:murein DD-endopeptidase MepM/ murein hydrolase activator NlpD
LTRRQSRQLEILATKHRPRQSYVRSLTSKLTAIGAAAGVAALIVSTSLPAAAFHGATSSAAASQTRPANPQSFVVEAAVAVFAPVSLDRDGYSVTVPPPPKAKSARSFAPAGGFLYTNNPGGTIQWPFPSYVPIASGFGPRIAPCGSCSSFHDGVDFLPGGGAAIGAIAPGVVSAVVADRGGYGTYVVVDHVVNGQNIQSTYAHMIAGSPTVIVGQSVTVAQTLGLVGNTGASTGAHLHLGISINGTFVDPFAWLKANAN